MIARRLLIAAVTAVLAFGLSAQTTPEDCGESHVVSRGDTLGRIASRCDTPLARILELNPDITNPDRIEVGQVIRLTGPVEHAAPEEESPSAAAVVVPEEAPIVMISPDSGPPGTDVILAAENLPPNQEVKLAGGPKHGAYSVIATAISSSEGRVERDLRVPENAPDDDDWLFWVLTTKPQEEHASNDFLVLPRVPQPAGVQTNETDRWPITMNILGTVTDEGYDCPTIRDGTGLIYAMTGNVPSGLSPGERVRIRGRLAERSDCLRGIAVEVRFFERLDEQKKEGSAQ